MNARAWFYGPSGFGSSRGTVDLSQSAPNERWTCRSCHRTTALNINGRCSACGSDAVQPTTTVEGECRVSR